MDMLIEFQKKEYKEEFWNKNGWDKGKGRPTHNIDGNK